MKKHIKKIIILSILSILAITFINYFANYSYPAALRIAGMTWTPGSSKVEVFSEFNRSRIVIYHGAEGTSIAHIQRDGIVWRPKRGTGEFFRDHETGLIQFHWQELTEINRHFGFSSSLQTNLNEEIESMESWVYEFNALFHGRNAIALIVIPQEKLPPGVAVRVRQYHNEYLIHLLSYEHRTMPSEIPIHPLLDVDVFELISPFIRN